VKRVATIAAMALLLSSCGGRGATNGVGTGAGGMPGLGGMPGVGGTPGLGGMAPMTCPTESLSDWCDRAPCPANEAAVPIECGMPPFQVRYDRWTTRCGGSAIVRNGGLWVEAWYFDSRGDLAGRAIMSDIGPTCTLGTFSYSRSFGELCELDESSPELCHEACPTEPCQPHATISSDFPVTLGDAAGMIFKACRDTSCLGAQVPSGWAVGQALVLEGGGGLQSATVTFSQGSAGPRLQLDWSMPEIDPSPTELYQAWLEDQVDKGRPSVQIFDVPITYDVNDLGCAGTCLVANVDLPAR
jgi:hypothetical protein